MKVKIAWIIQLTRGTDQRLDATTNEVVNDIQNRIRYDHRSRYGVVRGVFIRIAIDGAGPEVYNVRSGRTR